MKSLIRAVLLVSIVEGILALRNLFNIPSMARSAWLLGFSASRVLVAGGMLVALALLAWALVRSYRRPAWLEGVCTFIGRTANEKLLVGVLASLTWLALGLGTGAYAVLATPLVENVINVSTVRAALTRLEPALVWMAVVALQVVVVWLIAYTKKTRMPLGSSEDTTKAPLGKREIIGLAVTGLLAAALLYAGWKVFWFLTDDAHIAFRYVSNDVLGYGLVWNRPPFRPVEGYTSYLWVVLLNAVWRWTGVMPPEIANRISLLFSGLTLLTGALMFLKMRLPARLRRFRVVLLALALTGVLTNRTFLAWTSSGLETAMFNFFVTAWIGAMIFTPAYSRRWLAASTAFAVLSYLTRPDGILLVGATAVLAGPALYEKMRTKQFPGWELAASAPLLGFPAHMLWRHAFYGEWLPNTHFAKTVPGRYWVEAGSNYLLSFVIEYALWLWLLLLIVVLAIGLRRAGKAGFTKLWSDLRVPRVIRQPRQSFSALECSDRGVKAGVVLGIALAAGLATTLALIPSDQWGLGLWIAGTVMLGMALFVGLDLSLVESAVVMTLWAHVSYYTLRIGGDFFEFRVYSSLTPLIFLSFVWMLGRVRVGGVGATLALSAFIMASLPIPWLHWHASQARTTRQETYIMKVSVAEAAATAWNSLPGFVSGYLEWYDTIQFDLIEHFICMRHQEHKIFYEFLDNSLPNRETGFAISGENYPVLDYYAVGVAAWNLPHINILDGFGLNDYVVARNPELGPESSMAHERRAPAGYFECFQPNVLIDGHDVIITERSPALTAEKITACEEDFAARMEALNSD